MYNNRFSISVLLYLIVYTVSTKSQYTCSLKDPVAVTSVDPHFQTKPYVNGTKKFMFGVISDYQGSYENVLSPIFGPNNDREVIGTIAKMTSSDAEQAVESAKKAWNNGQGVWPQMSLEDRILAIQKVVESLKERREEIANTLMWEIAKTMDDAYAEFDRTMVFISATIEAYKAMDHANDWKTVSGIYARVRRAAIGILLVLGPFNYPLNETYATMIPALLAGNAVILKIPAIGGLVHFLTMEAYAKHLPPGVMTFVSGSGRVTVSPMMKTGAIDILAFIGGADAADTIIREHPHPHRLTRFLQLEGKNLGLVLPDADLKTAVDQLVLGALSYNGQRCTAIKLIMVHESIIHDFLPPFVRKVNSLTSGLPWEPNVSITPLPEGSKKMLFLEGLISDAVERGARIINDDDAFLIEERNKNQHPNDDYDNDDDRIKQQSSSSSSSSLMSSGGGSIHGLLMKPAIVYPVHKEMRLWSEEQFGPVIPIAVYKDTQEIIDYLATTAYGQQAAIFTSLNDDDRNEYTADNHSSISNSGNKMKTAVTAAAGSSAVGELIDAMSTVVGRININTQCGRSPDSLPFSGRRSSALGTMSITEAIRSFSIEVVMAGKDNAVNQAVMKQLEKTSQFLKPLMN